MAQIGENNTQLYIGSWGLIGTCKCDSMHETGFSINTPSTLLSVSTTEQGHALLQIGHRDLFLAWPENAVKTNVLCPASIAYVFEHCCIPALLC